MFKTEREISEKIKCVFNLLIQINVPGFKHHVSSLFNFEIFKDSLVFHIHYLKKKEKSHTWTVHCDRNIGLLFIAWFEKENRLGVNVSQILCQNRG